MAISRFGKTYNTLALALAAMALISLAPTPPALADAPHFYTIPINWTYTSTECGFPVIVHEEGEIAITVHSNNGANDFIGVDRFHLSGTFANQANGVIISYSEAAIIRGVREPDGSTGLVFSGILYNVHAPGQGSVGTFSGRAIVTGNP